MTIKVQVTGDDAAARQLRAFADDAERAAERGMERGADRVAATVAALVPQLSGALAASAGVVTAQEGPAVSLGEGLDYAAWIEFGGSRGRPYVPEGRYLYPTTVDAQDALADAGEQEVTRAVRGYAWH